MATDSVEESFAELLNRVRAGDAASAEVLVRRYEPAIRREVRFQLRDARTRQVLGASDLCQMVFGSFFVRAALGYFEVQSPKELLNLLMQITRNKLTDEVRRERTQRRGGDLQREGLHTPDGELRPVPGTEPTPSAYVASKDLVEQLMTQFTADERELYLLKADNLTWEEVAARIGGTAEARRKQYQRAIDRVANEMRLDSIELEG